jgi:hypothetical protein
MSRTHRFHLPQGLRQELVTQYKGADVVAIATVTGPRALHWRVLEPLGRTPSLLAAYLRQVTGEPQRRGKEVLALFKVSQQGTITVCPCFVRSSRGEILYGSDWLQAAGLPAESWPLPTRIVVLTLDIEAAVQQLRPSQN